MGGLPMQCAWCRRAYDAEGTHGPPLAGLLAGASHGICTDCLAQLLARQRELLRTAGELGRALAVERERLSVVLAALQERAARAIERSRALKEQSAAAVARAREVRHRRHLLGTRLTECRET